MNLNSIAMAKGLTDEEKNYVVELVSVWNLKLSRNKLKSKYYDSKNAIKNLGISIPKQLERIETCVSWPAKAVDALQARSRFDGFATDDDDVGNTLSRILSDNNFGIMYRQATTSELINSCSFITVTHGGEGDPSVSISFYSAETAAALWDYRRKRIKCGITIVDTTSSSGLSSAEPVWVNLYTDTDVIEIKKIGEEWSAERKPHQMGRPLMEVLVYKPSLKRPFGKSRISRPVMSITDNAVRSMLRAELGAEFYTTPQKYLLGAGDKDFERPKWEAYVGNIFLASKDADGDVPKFGQLPQASMQPHIDYLRSLAAQFSGATSIPISSLGVIHDNPASAEAIYAAKEDLIIEAESLNETNGAALKTVAMMAIAIDQDKTMDMLTDPERNIVPKFKNPARASIVSQADAIVKIISSMPWIAESQVALEEFGFDESQIGRLMRDKRKATARMLMSENQPQKQEDDGSATMYEISSIIKSYISKKITRKNAITLFCKVGISEDEALQILNDAEDAGETVDTVMSAVSGGGQSDS